MKKILNSEKKIRDHYEYIWSPPFKIKNREENPLLGFHYGLYTEGIKNWKDAALNMNKYIGQFFKLNKLSNRNILDAGCGIGSTAIYLAIKYPSTKFYGISIAPSEIRYAKHIQKQLQIKNIDFIQGSYIETNYSNEFFDGIYALESFSYASDKMKFISEMKRILKSKGNLVIIDGFRREKLLSPFMNKVYNSFLRRRALSNLISLNELQSYLINEGFTDIRLINLATSNGIIYNFLQLHYPIIIIKYVLDQYKKIIFGKKYQSKKNMDYIWGALVPELILGMNKKIGYYAISSVKK